MASSELTGRRTIGERRCARRLGRRQSERQPEARPALPDVAVEAGLGKLLTCDGISFAQQVKTFLGDFADDADAKAGRGTADG